MSKNNKLISENLRTEIAKELGVYDQVKKDGGSWENVSSKTCGNIVSKAIEIANRTVENQLRITLYENGGTCDIVTAHIECLLAGNKICLAGFHVFWSAPLSCIIRNSRNDNFIGRSKCSCLSCS